MRSNISSKRKRSVIALAKVEIDLTGKDREVNIVLYRE